MARKVFISYRRSDDPFVAQLLYLILAETLPPDFTFLDVERLLPGRSFDTQLMQAVSASEVILMIIGPRWDWSRLNEPNDYVRREIATALNQNKQIIPLLIEGASLPDKYHLPTELQRLPEMQGGRLRIERFKNDVQELCLRSGIFSQQELSAGNGWSDRAVEEQHKLVTKFSHLSSILNALMLAGLGGLIAEAQVKNVAKNEDLPHGEIDWSTYTESWVESAPPRSGSLKRLFKEDDH